MNAVCLGCVRGWHEECIIPDDNGECCCKASVNALVPEANGKTGERDGMAWSKEDASIRDAKSTGRKRAAKLYPLQADMPCDWRGLRFAGGGMFPIVGCKDGNQNARHHGPDLSTLNNQEGNVHRICADDHNSWHANNDAFIREYADSILWRPHDSETKWTLEEYAEAMLVGRAKFSRDRFQWRAYSKDVDDYREFIKAKEGSSSVYPTGVEG